MSREAKEKSPEADQLCQHGKSYWLYLLECKGGSFYAGITLDVQARFAKHQAGKGAAYTRARPPLRVLARMSFPGKSEALKAEYAVKQLPKAKKPAFFSAAAQ